MQTVKDKSWSGSVINAYHFNRHPNFVSCHSKHLYEKQLYN